MTNVLGPQGPNHVTVRPPCDPAASGGLQTWFQDCSAPAAQDGTLVTASFFNAIVGQLVYLSQQTGIQPIGECDDTFLYRAIQVASGSGSGGSTTTTPPPSGGFTFIDIV